MLVTVRYEGYSEEEETIVGIRETKGESGDMGAWLYPVSRRLHRICGVDGYVPAAVSKLDYLGKETKILFPCYNIVVGFGRACAPVCCAHPSFWAHKHAKLALRAQYSSFAASPKNKK